MIEFKNISKWFKYFIVLLSVFIVSCTINLYKSTNYKPPVVNKTNKANFRNIINNNNKIYYGKYCKCKCNKK